MNAALKNIFPFLLLFSLASHCPASNDQDIQKKQSQIEQLRKEIDKYENKIKESSKKEKATVDLLSTYDRQSMLLRKLISKLKEREVALESEIKQTRETAGQLGGQLSSLKKHYAGYVSTAYKFGKSYDLELLISSKSFNQLLIRSEYLRRFSDKRRKDMLDIDTKKTAMERQDLLLNQQLEEQQNLLQQKKKEENRLAAKAKKRKNILAEIRRDKKNFKKEIDRRKQDVREMEKIIARLIEEEMASRAKKERGPEALSGKSFSAKRGFLRWPVDNGRITARFGTEQHPTLRTITQNTGIDITVKTGSTVYAVADGEVSKIHWLPSFGNLLILNHRDGYRTVYAHLSDISVNEGESIKEGAKIGNSGEAIAGSILHFEIYKEREKLNPEEWLRGK